MGYTSNTGTLTSSNDRNYITDSRGSQRAPSYYNDRYAQWDFQSTNDTLAGGDSWHGLLTVAKWGNFHASHRQEQLIFTGDDLKRRTATSDSAWGSVKTIYDSGNLTLGTLGYTGATNANYITNNSQLSNGAGYITDGNTNWNNTYNFVTSSGNTIIGTDADINTSGATIIDNLYMTDGVITSHGTRVLSLGDLGYTGATNANYITNNNQLTNGASYLTTAGKAADSNLLDGLNSTAYMRDDGWNTSPGQDANTQTGMRSDFSYGNNAPNVGELLRFGAGNYSTQFSSQYAGVGKGLNFRTRNGDAASWNPWYGIWHTGNLTSNSQLTNGSNYVSYVNTDQIGASLFYDLNDSNYFLDLNATSRLNRLQTVSTGVNKNSSQTTKDGLSLYGAYTGGEATYGMMFSGTAGSGTHGGVTSDWATYFTMNNSTNRGWIFRRVGSGNSASISAGGVATFDSNVKSPIFYDSNSTGYYLNPSGTSNLNAVTVNGSLDMTDDSISIDNQKGFSNSGAWTRNQTPHGYIDFGPANTGHAHIYTDRSNFYFNKMIQVLGGSQLNQNDIRSKMFYDIDNTGYYLNPASTSNLNIVQAVQFQGSLAGTASNANTLDSFSSESFLRSDADDTVNAGVTYTWTRTDTAGIVFVNNSYNTQLAMGGWTTANSSNVSRIRTSSGNLHMDSASNGAMYLNWYSGGAVKTNSILQSDASLRAPIFYDSNNTSYYVDAGSTTQLNHLSVNSTLASRNFAAGSMGYILENRSADGATFRFDGDTFIFYGGGGVGNVFEMNQNGNSTARTSLRAPIFYDSNDTGYYLNPASTSNLNGLTVNGTITGNISGNANTLDNIDSGSFLRSDATDYQNNTIYQRGYLVNETGYRNRGVYGNYSSTKTNHIWSMGVAYKNHASGTNFGNLYGLAYKHTNNTTGGSMAGGHQMVWCSNGTGRSAMGDNIWTSGNVKAPIFYDSNNTGYYLNPASTSNLNVLTLAGTATASNFILSSDERKKTKIKDLPRNNINTNWKSFEMKNDEGEYRTGVIAQELEETHPEFVNTDPEGFKSVKYIDLLIAKIAELEARLEKLEK